MEIKVKEKYINEIISYINSNVDNHDNILNEYIVPKICQYDFSLVDSLELLEKCPEIIDLIKFNEEIDVNSTLYLAYNNIIEEEFLANSCGDMKAFLDKKTSNMSDINYLKLYYIDISQYRILNKEETINLFKKLRNKDGIINEEIKNQIINHNLRWAAHLAKKYSMNSNLPILDLIQQANIGLIKAVKKYDYTKGYTFTTYSTWWIRQSMTRYANDHSRLICLPTHLSQDIKKVKRIENALNGELGRFPTEEELAERLKIEVEKLQELKKYDRIPISLDAPIINNDGDDDMSYGDLLKDEDDYTIDDLPDKMILLDFKEDYKNCNILTPREKRIIDLRFGLEDGKEYTLEEVGNVFNVTRERIRQIEKKALIKLGNRYKKSKKFNNYVPKYASKSLTREKRSRI